jgi:16S rRNA (uracil1498-N3)-methyltransferase
MERWRRIAIAAAKQAHNPFLLEVHSVITLSDFVTLLDPEGMKLVAHPSPEGRFTMEKSFRELPGLHLGPQGPWYVVIGPEGGLSTEELEDLKARGFVRLSLGGTRLRTETAAIAATTHIMTMEEERVRRS